MKPKDIELFALLRKGLSTGTSDLASAWAAASAPVSIPPDDEPAPEANPADLNTRWDACMAIFRENVSSQVFRTWFEQLRPLSIENSVLTLAVPSQFFYEYLEERYYPLIHRAVDSAFGTSITLNYEVIAQEQGEKQGEPAAIPAPAPTPAAEPAHSQQPQQRPKPGTKRKQGDNTAQSAMTFEAQEIAPQSYPTNLNPRYTFDNFIRGESNQLAVAAAMAIAQKPGSTRYNPFVVYGDTGLGKTHLVQSIGNQAIEMHPGIRVLFTNSELFTMEYVNAIQNNRLNDFTNFYRSVDILIVDDIQFFAAKEKTQDNFFHTFNALHQSGKQIILTSDKPPKELHGVDDRLISRFQWGLTADVQPPDFEMRMAILLKKASDEGVDLPGDVLEFVARHVTGSVRELEGCLISLIAKVTLDERALTLDLAREVVAGLTTAQKAIRKMSVKEIQTAVAATFMVDVEQLAGKSRKAEIVLPRQIAMYLCKEYTELSLKSIGQHFGNRDHSTVLHSCTVIEDAVRLQDEKIAEPLQAVLAALKLSAH